MCSPIFIRSLLSIKTNKTHFKRNSLYLMDFKENKAIGNVVEISVSLSFRSTNDVVFSFIRLERLADSGPTVEVLTNPALPLLTQG